MNGNVTPLALAASVASVVAFGCQADPPSDRSAVDTPTTASATPAPLPTTPRDAQPPRRTSSANTGSRQPEADTPWWRHASPLATVVASAPLDDVRRGPHVELAVPPGWVGVGMRDSMNDNVLGSLVRSEDKRALALVQFVQTDHDRLLDRRADAALRISGGLAWSRWDNDVAQVSNQGQPASLKFGTGALRGTKVNLLQLRQRLSMSGTDGTMQLIGVLPEDASDLQRSRYAALLGSFKVKSSGR